MCSGVQLHQVICHLSDQVKVVWCKRHFNDIWVSFFANWVATYALLPTLTQQNHLNLIPRCYFTLRICDIQLSFPRNKYYVIMGDWQNHWRWQTPHIQSNLRLPSVSAWPDAWFVEWLRKSGIWFQKILLGEYYLRLKKQHTLLTYYA